MEHPTEGDIAVVTTRSGVKYVATYTLAPGIDYFWNPVISPKGFLGSLIDPDESYVIIGTSLTYPH